MRYPEQYFQSLDRGMRQRAESRVTAARSRRMSHITATGGNFGRPAGGDAGPALRTKVVNDDQKSVSVSEVSKDIGAVRGLDYEAWLPIASKVYHISPEIQDYILVNTVVCPSVLPNRNGIGYPSKELARQIKPPTRVFEDWKYKPVCLEHDSEHPEESYGVILDTTLTRVTGYGQGKLWKVMGLLAIDKVKHPDIAYKVLNGDYDTYSMGAMVQGFTCSYCGTECYHDPDTGRDYGCHHITSTKNVNWGIQKDPAGNDHLTFLNAYGICPVECSIVADPAWTPALSDQVWEHTPSAPPIQAQNPQKSPSGSVFEGFPNWLGKY